MSDSASARDGGFWSMASAIMPIHLLGRLYFLFAIITFEYMFCFGGRGTIPGHLEFFAAPTDRYGQIPLFALVVFLGFGHRRLKAQREEISLGRISFLGHLLCIAAVLFINFLAAQEGLPWLLFDPSSYVKCAVYLLATVLLVLACFPLRSWLLAIRATGRLWLYASTAGVAGWFLGSPIRLLWNATSTVQSGVMQRTTLYAVSAVLRHFLPDLIVDPATFMIGTPRYLIIIAGGCSGVEGLGLVLIFTSFWLWTYRKEIRFPLALLLIPCALGCSWLLNIVRLCALILIENAGGSEVASVGFHAQAGWIAFILIALAFSMATLKIPWLRKAPSAAFSTAGDAPSGGINTGTGAEAASNQERGESPAIRGYLVPFLAILAASFVSKAASGYFEWLYPLRFVAAAAAIWYFWPELKKLNWRFGWAGPLAGVVVFLVWIAPTAWSHHFATSRLGPSLAALSPTARWAWIAFRVAAAVVTVPIAEELAFRGYLARRFLRRDFDSVPFTGLTALSIALSSVAFGLMHGQQWGVGILAGLAYAFALRWRGRMGDAVVAHAVSNLLLAAWVLGFGDWAQW
jgi:exosortase E/protease (VPEID-CTERM system)